ncbi:helix-turn-helix domain-containing protein [Nakamurella antarctica]|uniref:helix-turn-helix domain-containing protein n=1 Tax=Nakamurella antarctica TaxID=1902245 RepID=UPI0026B6BA83
MLLRDALGETLRDARTRQNRTLRDVSHAANVSLGYLSEVERGRKEASSELLASICAALEVQLHDVLNTVSAALSNDQAHAELLRSQPVADHRNGSLQPAGGSNKNNVKNGSKNSNDAVLRIVVPYGKTRGGKEVALA